MNEAPVPKWFEGLKALTNVGPVFRMVWDAAPNVVIGSLICRMTAALIPLATLAVTKFVVDSIVGVTAHQRSLPWFFWWLVAGEFLLAGIAAVLVRTVDFCDTILADRHTRYVSTRIMEHASRLDLTCYEDPLFCDKMERARVQGTDRLLMIQATGSEPALRTADDYARHCGFAGFQPRCPERDQCATTISRCFPVTA